MAQTVPDASEGQLDSYSNANETDIPGRSLCFVSFRAKQLTTTTESSDDLGAIEYYPHGQDSADTYPPDTSSNGAYRDVERFPVNTAQPSLVTSVAYGSPIATSPRPQEQRHHLGQVFSNKPPGKRPGRDFAADGVDSAGQKLSLGQVPSQPLSLTTRYGRGQKGAPASKTSHQLSQTGQIHSVSKAGGRGLVAPGTRYKPAYSGLQLQHAHTSDPSSARLSHHKEGAATGSLSVQHRDHTLNAAVNFDDMEYRKLHRRREPRTDSRGQKVEFTCLLLTHPDVIEEWKQVGRTDAEIQALVQYYQQVCQVCGSRKVDRLMDARHGPSQDPLDHRVQFSGNAGMPTFWFELQAAPWEDTSAAQFQPAFQKSGKNFELVTGRRSHEVIPLGATLEYIAKNMPNHYQHEHVDAFLQHGRLHAGTIWRTVPAQHKALWRDLGVSKASWQANFIHNRRRDRQAEFINQYGSNAMLNFYGSNLKLRDRGDIAYEDSKETLPERDIPPQRISGKTYRVEDKSQRPAALSPGLQAHATEGETSAYPLKHPAAGGQAAQITRTQQVHTSALAAHGNFNARPPPNREHVFLQPDFSNPDILDANNQDTSASIQYTNNTSKQYQTPVSSDLQRAMQSSKAAPGKPTAMDNLEIDPALLLTKEPSQTQPSEKALGKRPAVEPGNTALQNCMQTAQPQPSEKALGKRPAFVGALDPRLVALGARPAQMKGGKRVPRKGQKGKSTQAGAQKSASESLTGPTAMEGADLPEQGVTQRGAERGQRLLEQMGLGGNVQLGGAPASAAAPAPAPAPVDLPVFNSGQRISCRGQAEGLSHADYSDLRPSQRPAYIVTDAERRALVADANWRVQTRQPPINPDSAPRVLAADVPVSVQDMATVLPDSATIERWKREEGSSRRGVGSSS